MGHAQSADDLNLGLGWIYYGLARTIRPTTVVVIGSFRGFVPLILGRALADNREGGEVLFVDPSLVDDFWTDAGAVEAYFAAYGVTNVRHFLMTTQQFAETDVYRGLAGVGMVFIDGYHSEEQARFDYAAFADRIDPRGVILFHDTLVVRVSRIYGEERAYEHRVKVVVDALREDPELEVFDLPFGQGVTLVRKVAAEAPAGEAGAATAAGAEVTTA